MRCISYAKMEGKPWRTLVSSEKPQKPAPLTGGLTTDRNHPGLHKTRPDGQREVYLVLSEEERAKGFIRPVRRAYVHSKCGALTTMGLALCETYARTPTYYSHTFCATCRDHFPVNEFIWEDGFTVGT